MTEGFMGSENGDDGRGSIVVRRCAGRERAIHAPTTIPSSGGRGESAGKGMVSCPKLDARKPLSTLTVLTWFHRTRGGWNGIR